MSERIYVLLTWPRYSRFPLAVVLCSFLLTALLPAMVLADDDDDDDDDGSLNTELVFVLENAGFTGEVESTLDQRLGRPLDAALVDLGRLLFFDEIMSLHDDNACAGCHTPAFGFGDPGSMAIGVGNNRIVGPRRTGARNQRKAPILTNTTFMPRLMVNGRFEANSGDPFDNSEGFTFPFPNDTRFGPNDQEIPTLLSAQGFIPPTEIVEMAGFQGTAGTIGPRFDQFDDGVGTPLLPADETGTREEPIRAQVLERLNANAEYRDLFAALFGPGDITFSMVGRAFAEFQTSLLAANAPIDRFARGEHGAMNEEQKRGALLFFGEARCVECHAVVGQANEMFSDFANRVIGIPQIHPEFGVGRGNVLFDGPGEDEDFGREQVSGDPDDRYKFRTSPIRNVAVQRAFFHNGAFTRLEDAIRHHLDIFSSAIDYDPDDAGVDDDLHSLGPLGPVLERVDPILQAPIHLDDDELEDLVEFVERGLLDPRALPGELCNRVPDSVPSGRPLPLFEGCERVNICHVIKPGKEKTLTLKRSQVAGHLAHGDRRGSCHL